MGISRSRSSNAFNSVRRGSGHYLRTLEPVSEVEESLGPVVLGTFRGERSSAVVPKAEPLPATPPYKPLPLTVARVIADYAALVSNPPLASPTTVVARWARRRQHLAEDVFLALSDLDPDLVDVAVRHAARDWSPGDLLPTVREIADAAVEVFIGAEEP